MDQHFMNDRKTIEKIVDLGDLRSEDQILEIGPGTGNLTKYLLKKGVKVIAVEMDESLKKTLKEQFGKEKNLDLIFGNALDVMEKLKFNKIISNIPYSICEPLINKLMKTEFDLAVMSAPKDFVEILLAKPDEKKYSKLSIKSQSFFHVKMEFEIPRTSFTPEPKTDSVAFVLKNLSKKDYDKEPEKYVLREMFIDKKRKLLNALREALIDLNKNIFGKEFTKNLARERIEKIDIDKKILEKKIEELNLKEIEKISMEIRALA